MAIQWELLLFSLFVAMGMGTFSFVAVTEVYGKLENVRLPGVITSLALLGLGGLASFFHLGHPERIFHMLGNMGSAISQEFITAGFAGGIVALYAILLLKKDSSPKWRRNVALVGIVAAFAVTFSTGKIYLQGARPGWNTLTIPLLYVASAGPLGLFMMFTWTALKADDRSLFKTINKITFVTQLVFGAMILMYVYYLTGAPFPDPSRSAARLLTGDFAAAFWGLVVVVGVVIPLAITGSKLSSDHKDVSVMLPLVGLVCTIVGAGSIRALMYLMGSSVHQYIIS